MSARKVNAMFNLTLRARQSANVIALTN